MPEAVILAGGLGTRLQLVLKDIPKAMAPVNGRPFLEYLLDYLAANGIDKFVLSVGHGSEIILDHFGSDYKGVKIDYVIEKKPLGTGGGIRLALEHCKDKDVFVLNGDTLFLIDFKGFRARHLRTNAMIGIALRKVRDISRYGSVRINDDDKIIAFGEKTTSRLHGLINGGIYIINRNYFLNSDLSGTFSIEKDCFEHWHRNGLVAGFSYDAYFLDIGIPEDYLKAQDEFRKLAY